MTDSSSTTKVLICPPDSIIVNYALLHQLDSFELPSTTEKSALFRRNVHLLGRFGQVFTR